ncbi:MAG: Deoxyuridine 5'-triphosphate nucleotidohydrolase [Caldanaerobacter subterraneus]|jgi:dUTP pyrophosphatase|uniref:Deoxyuridine 5'-triphosphate nucleotidohydrolase n=3 Tax=Caldanaerobacter subterraneus TaxID=911092 RepID=DUT_CALS4|nr:MULTISPECIES: dUTP diphosphatase [Caldanaerobacter]Q8RA46.1 RecName: Full=Deoxyuridine 5'-triphosphate nucleotidohydrolase; Short=dUTPase; AltName: Full=dUTP pyrophosphatase [Caldanaerobacter subterraneus subsp. tengcongensis MB4]AAM24606.1 dUTPase [Caldanaerobacter subterraneus subsp. tengcongensis MB4]KKC29583.1 dUTPase [Caldanaerobacter subterraneus subsp. pacificus DSM 12653]KUK07990.1 MAG: Deoxyuridine 5'-triphosphate nucleotidohydrolase [Caldanaerobacter subterraneus]MCS3915831.1 dUTP
MSIVLKIKRTEDAKDLPLPAYMSEGAAGMDLYANVKGEVTINPGEVELIPTGIQIELPPNYEAQIRPRSGLALNYGITLLNTPGTVDSDYRGEIKLIVINLGKQPVTIKRGQRIAQMVINQVVRPKIIEVEELSETERMDRGFGHTGV